MDVLFPELWHLLWAFVEGGDDFGVGEGAGVDADFVVGRGDESAEDEHRGLLPRRLACAFAEAGVVLVELEHHAVAGFLGRDGVEMLLPVDKKLAAADLLGFFKTPDATRPFLAVTRPCPGYTVILAVYGGGDSEYEITFRAKALVRR